MPTKSKVIVALDLEDKNKLDNILSRLDPQSCRLKVGKTLFTQKGPQWIKELHLHGFEVFLDLKFHDIPQQVAGACEQAAELGVWMVNVHALGGMAMLKAAKAAVEKAKAQRGQRPLLIGVTLLTSLGVEDLTQLGIQGSMEEAVLRLATLCFEAGLDGVVCSAQEVSQLKKRFGSQFLCVTPGIRLPENSHQDQQRVMTPQAAITAGSDYLVIGRPITQAPEPSQLLHQINQSIASL